MSDKLLNFCHSLVLVHAYSVLQETLEQYEREGLISPQRPGLKNLMTASQTELDWIDYGKVDDGREARNGVAHDGKILPRLDSWSYIEAIEKELLGWGVVRLDHDARARDGNP